MSYRVLKLVLIAMCALAVPFGVAGEPLDKARLEKLRAAMEAPGAGLKVVSAQTSEIPGLYEVQLADGPLVYATLKGDFFIVGDLYSVTPQGYVNLAEKRRDGERMARLAEVKKEDMIDQVYPRHKNSLRAPDCRCCHRLRLMSCLVRHLHRGQTPLELDCRCHRK